VHSPEFHVGVCLKKLEILHVPCQYMFSLMNFVVSNQEHFQTNLSLQILTQGISTIFVDQMPTSPVFKKVLFVLALEISTVYHVV
jgi:hypothetical protein